MSSHDQRRPSARDRHALRRAWLAERAEARVARTSGNAACEWDHLERAHILSQPMAGRHVRTHLAMLSYGIRARDGREVCGQLIRLILAGPGSISGRYPEGNTGGAAISAFEVLPIPLDLVGLLRATS